jgi:hypothetical protein
MDYTLLYTAGLRGDLDLLPKLYTFLKALRGEFGASHLVDLGDSCAEGIWHCDATDGRSLLIGLDAMGYTAVNAAHLTAESRRKLAEQTSIGLVDQQHLHTAGDVLFALRPASGDGHLCVVLTPSPETRFHENILHLQPVERGQVGVARIDNGQLAAQVHLMPPATAPDATIAGVVDFIRDEARYYQKRKSEKM